MRTHHVAALDPGLLRRATRADVRDQHPRAAPRGPSGLGQVRGQVLDRHAQPAAHHLAVLEQALHDRPGHVGGDGEADALVAAGAREDRGVDADQLAVHVDQRAARVAGVDRRVGLDEVLVVGDAHVGAALGRDDAHRSPSGPRRTGCRWRAPRPPAAGRPSRRAAAACRSLGWPCSSQHREVALRDRCRRSWPRARGSSARVTWISSACSTTWLLVSTMPSAATITPEPRLCCAALARAWREAGALAEEVAEEGVVEEGRPAARCCAGPPCVRRDVDHRGQARSATSAMEALLRPCARRRRRSVAAATAQRARSGQPRCRQPTGSGCRPPASRAAQPTRSRLAGQRPGAPSWFV